MESMAKQQGGPPAQGGKPRGNGSEKILGANSEIARKLGDYFKGIESEEVPDHFLQLLNRLEQTETAQKKD
jgi:hypothetical protein